MTARNATLLAAVTIAVAVLVTFGSSWDNYFSCHDDFYWLEKSHTLCEDGVWNVLVPRRGMYYRPLHVLFFHISYRLWGLNPIPYHLGNLGVHFAGCLGLYLLFRKLGLEQRAAMLAALLYAVSKPMSECVPWLSCMHDLLGSLFAILAVICLLQWMERGGWWWVGLALCVGLALLSKEDSIGIVPPLLFLSLIWKRGEEVQEEVTGTHIQRVAVVAVVLVVLVAGYVPCVLTSSDRPGQMAQGAYSASWDGVGMESQHFVDFLKSACAAQPLLEAGHLVTSGLLLLFACWLIVRTRSRVLAFLGFWVVSASALLSSVTGGMGRSELRYQHLPWLGLAGITVIVLVPAARKLLKGKLSILELLVLGAFLEVTAIGINPFGEVPTMEKEVICAPLVVGLWLILTFMRHRRDGWIALAFGVFVAKALAFWLFPNTPWWVWLSGSWGGAVLLVRLSRREWPDRGELAMAGIIASLAFGPLNRSWLGILAYSMILELLSMAASHWRQRGWLGRVEPVYLVLVAVIIAPTIGRLAESRGWEDGPKAVRVTVASLPEELPIKKGVVYILWERGNVYGIPGLLGSFYGFPPDVDFRIVQGRPRSLPQDGAMVISRDFGEPLEFRPQRAVSPIPEGSAPIGPH